MTCQILERENLPLYSVINLSMANCLIKLNIYIWILFLMIPNRKNPDSYTRPCIHNEIKVILSKWYNKMSDMFQY